MNEIVEKIVKDIIEFKNKEKLNWGRVCDIFVSKYTDGTKYDKNLVLLYTVSSITKHGYSIEDHPFKLVKF